MVTPKIAESSFKKTGVSYALDGTEDHPLWDVSNDGDGSESTGFNDSRSNSSKTKKVLSKMTVFWLCCNCFLLCVYSV